MILDEVANATASRKPCTVLNSTRRAAIFERSLQVCTNNDTHAKRT